MNAGASGYQGPVSDYAVVFLDDDLNSVGITTKTGGSSWWNHYNSCLPAHVELQKGAIRLAYNNCPASGSNPYKAWRPRDTMARITDGTSNTILVGEKHLRNGELNQYAGGNAKKQDGHFLFEAGGYREYNIARNIRLSIGKGPNDKANGPNQGPHNNYGFGSWHSGVTQFVRGDGSVHAVSWNIDDATKNRLGHAQDGQNIVE